MGLNDLIELDIDTPESLPDLGIYRLALHAIQIFFAFLTFCIIIPVISIQGRYHGNSLGAPNYTLVVALFSILVSVALALFPLVKYRNHLIPVRKFFLRPRTAVIFTCFFTLGWFAAMISMSAHANNDENCTLNLELQKKDSKYAGNWMKQCNSAKAAAAFCWLSFFVWVATAAINIVLLWHEKKISHAETARHNENNSNDEDVRTIVDMDMDTKDKPYDCDTMSSINSQKEPSSPKDTPLPPPSALSVNTNGFSSPMEATPPVPTNLVSPFHPNVNSPYPVASSPYYTQSPSPYAAYQQPYIAPYSNEQSLNHSPSLYRDPSVVYHPPHRSYHTNQQNSYSYH